MASHSEASSDLDAVIIDRDDISNYNPEQILPESPETISKIREWLQPTSYNLENGEYRKHLGSHEPGTGDWLTASNVYQQWEQGDQHGLLWLRGIPGSGKSVQAAKITDRLKRNHPGSPVLYFFFRQIIDANHKPVALLRDWLDQVLSYSPPLQRHLKGYVESQRKLESFSMEDLWKDLKLAFSSLPGRVYCVADALDEMDRGNDAFLVALAELGQWRPCSVKLLITSRPVSSIETPLRNSKACHIRLEENLVDIDIAAFVQHNLERSDIGLADRKVIREAIPGRANGLFLFAKLAMEAFLEAGARTDEVLLRLPLDLNHMYTELLKEHSQRTGVPENIQLLILGWVTHATRPLRLLELAEVIRVVHPVGGQPRDLKATKDLVRVACGSLLEVLPDETVCVVHHSFTEFLQGSTRTAKSHGYPILTPGLTHSRLAIACLTYLQAGSLDFVKGKAQHQAYESHSVSGSCTYPPHKNSALSSTGEVNHKLKYPFLEYAAVNWHVHARRSENAGEDAGIVTTSIGGLLDNPDRKEAWLKFGWPGGYPAESSVTNLHVAAKTGLRSYVKNLLSAGTPNIDQLDENGCTPLWLAAEHGHADIIRLLVKAGADPDKENDVDGLKPLHMAARNNNYEAVTALLEAGVNPLTPKTKEYPGRMCGNAGSSVGQTPLMYACESGHWKSVEAFLPFLKERHLAHWALCWSIRSRQDHVAEKLLPRASLDINAKYRGDTALFLASCEGNKKLIATLLRAGADPTIFCNDSGDEFAGMGSYRDYFPGDEYSDPDPTRGTTALQKFCGACFQDCMTQLQDFESIRSTIELFIQHGASIHQQTQIGRTPLHAAIHDPVLTRILIDSGADVNTEDDDGATPLHLAQSDGVIAVLVANGANINKRSKNGRTPLFSKLRAQGGPNISKFLEFGPDCNIVDKSGNGILHVAAKRTFDKVEVLGPLLQAGADPCLKNHDGYTPLHYMKDRLCDEDTSQALDMMIGAGADVNARNKTGASLLFLALQGGLGRTATHDDLKQLLERGASTDIRDYEGRTLLHEAVLRHSTRGEEEYGKTRLDFFLGLGLDPHVVDFHGNNLLHELASRGNDEKFLGLWQQLIALGLDPAAANNRGRTPLHLLSTKTMDNSCHPDRYYPIDLLVERLETVDVQDEDGITPLHIAATLSPATVKKLLGVGADASKLTFDHLSPLHLAAAARQSNIVGVLLDHLREKGKNTGYRSPWVDGKLDEPVSGVDAQMANGWTPLFYACRSGRPETVSLLLRAGANVTVGKSCHMTVLNACADFESEQALWESSSRQRNGAIELGAGIKLTDYSRPSMEGHTLTNWREEIRRNIDTTRLEEIIEMLASHGTGIPDGGYRVPIYTMVAGTLQGRASYTVERLERFNRDRGVNDDDFFTTGSITSANRFTEHTLSYYRDVKVRALREFGELEQGTRNEDIFRMLMLQREYDLVASLPDLGTDFVTRDLNGINNIEILIQHGFASLLSRIGAIEAERNFATGRWHAAGAPDKPGLGVYVPDPDAEPPSYLVEPTSFLVLAVQRDLPNLDVLRVLVDELGVDVNEFTTRKQWVSVDGDAEYTAAPTESALHQAALAKSWWHHSQAIPFLVSRGADPNLRNYQGQTPLHFALAGGGGHYPGPFREEAVRALIAAGADINNVAGTNCLGYAATSVRLVRLLLENGAIADGETLAQAVRGQNLDVLQCLLAAGADPNACKKPPAAAAPPAEAADGNPPPSGSESARGAFLDDETDFREWCPLYIAAQGPDRPLYLVSRGQMDNMDTYRRMVEMLLAAGADPFATVSAGDEDGEDDDYEGDPIQEEGKEGEEGAQDLGSSTSAKARTGRKGTLLHEIILKGHNVQPFFALPGLDPNRRDSKGRTLLHAVCLSPQGPDALLNVFPTDKTKDQSDVSPPSRLDRLLALGADPLALDNNGNNAIHCLLGPGSYRMAERLYLGSLHRLAIAHPSLLSQRNAQGRTPLLLAAQQTATDGDTRRVSALLTLGCDVTVADKFGNTALHALAPRLDNCKDIVNLFKDFVTRGADISARNAAGETPLFAYFGDTKDPRYRSYYGGENLTSPRDILQMLDEAGADFSARENKGRGLLHAVARRKGFSGTVCFAMLLDHGLDPLALDGEERSALDIAAVCGNTEVLSFFKRGASGGWDKDKVHKLLQEDYQPTTLY